jgi:hypothetical protein
MSECGLPSGMDSGFEVLQYVPRLVGRGISALGAIAHVLR